MVILSRKDAAVLDSMLKGMVEVFTSYKDKNVIIEEDDYGRPVEESVIATEEGPPIYVNPMEGDSMAV